MMLQLNPTIDVATPLGDGEAIMVIDYGGLKEIVYMGGGSKHGFAFGFPVGCLHYQKGFVGDCKITYVMDGW